MGDGPAVVAKSGLVAEQTGWGAAETDEVTYDNRAEDGRTQDVETKAQDVLTIGEPQHSPEIH
jgi:hypothetical protein